MVASIAAPQMTCKQCGAQMRVIWTGHTRGLSISCGGDDPPMTARLLVCPNDRGDHGKAGKRASWWYLL